MSFVLVGGLPVIYILCADHVGKPELSLNLITSARKPLLSHLLHRVSISHDQNIHPETFVA